MTGMTVGFAMCGSFCTIDKAIIEIEKLIENGARIIPILSPSVNTTNTRFGNAKERVERIIKLTEIDPITTIEKAEPIGPKGLLDILIIAPCTGNTLGKLANGITDTAVTMAAKAHLRNNRPLLIAMATNDALSASLQNVARLINTKNVFFVPFGQDDPINKPTSMICDFGKILPSARQALSGKQLQPILL